MNTHVSILKNKEKEGHNESKLRAGVCTEVSCSQRSVSS